MTIQRAARRPGQPTAGAPTGASHLHQGAEARRIAMAEIERSTQQRERAIMGLDLNQVNRYRFRLQEGEEADIIVLDASVDGAGFAYEHHMADSEGRFTIFEQCPREYSHCPLCDGIDRQQSSYVMYLTVLDLRGFTRRGRDGADGEFVPHYKRLMVVKQNLQPEFFKLSDAAVAAHGTMRGMQLLMARDGTINSAIGNPVMMPSGAMFEIIPEADLLAEFGAAEERNEANELVKAENYDITPFAYTQLFPRPSGEDLRRRYAAGGGGGAGGSTTPAGSRADTSSEWGAQEGRQAPPRTRSRVGPGGGAGGGGSAFGGGFSRPAPADPDPGLAPRTRVRSAPQDTEEREEVEETRPARTRSRAPAQPTGGRPAGVTVARTRAPIQRNASVRSAGVPSDLDDEIPF